MATLVPIFTFWPRRCALLIDLDLQPVAISALAAVYLNFIGQMKFIEK